VLYCTAQVPGALQAALAFIVRAQALLAEEIVHYVGAVAPSQTHPEPSGRAATGGTMRLRWIVRDVELWCVNDRSGSSPRAFVVRTSCRGRAAIDVHEAVLQSVAMRLEDAQVCC
jgi:hypothetical protein